MSDAPTITLPCHIQVKHILRQLLIDLTVPTRELHGDGDDGIAAVTAVERCNGVRLYDGHRGDSGDGDNIHGSTLVAVTDCYSYMDLSELKNITEHLLTDNELFFLICLLCSLHMLS